MRWVVGLLLVFAAVLKGTQLIAESGAALATAYGRWLMPVQAGVELGIGLLMLSGLYWQQLRWLALLLFTTFATYSLYLALGGTQSCGCFGPVKIHPWWTFLLDVTVVLGLLAAIRHQQENPTTTPQIANWIYQPAIASLIIAGTVVGIALLVRQGASRAASARVLLSTAGNRVILEPANWVGKPLPIADAIDLDLTQGHWIVLLHRHDCPDCEAAAPRYEELALQQPVALVEIPPYADLHGSATGAAHRARLSNNREWFIKTPVEIQIQDGIVLAVKNGYGD